MKIYIQNKSSKEAVELVKLDGITTIARLAPGNYVELENKTGPVAPFIVKELKPNS